jgi:hypothetical protein
MMSKAWKWMEGDQSKWCKLTFGKDEEMEISPKVKVYVRSFVFTS